MIACRADGQHTPVNRRSSNPRQERASALRNSLDCDVENLARITPPVPNSSQGQARGHGSNPLLLSFRACSFGPGKAELKSGSHGDRADLPPWLYSLAGSAWADKVAAPNSFSRNARLHLRQEPSGRICKRLFHARQLSMEILKCPTKGLKAWTR